MWNGCFAARERNAISRRIRRRRSARTASSTRMVGFDFDFACNVHETPFCDLDAQLDLLYFAPRKCSL